MTPTPLPTVQAGSGDPTLDWATVIVALFAGILGGVVSALITAVAQKGLARTSARAAAASALWTFQRTLHDYAVEGESHFLRDGTATLTATAAADIAAARAKAYPYRDYLKDSASLVERHWRDDGEPWGDPIAPYGEMFEWSKDVADAIKAEFGKDPR